MLTTAPPCVLLRQWMTVFYVQILQSLVLAVLLINGYRRSAIYLIKSIQATTSKRATSIGGQKLLCHVSDDLFNQTPFLTKAKLQSSIQLRDLINYIYNVVQVTEYKIIFFSLFFFSQLPDYPF